MTDPVSDKVKCRIQFLIDHGASFKGSGAVITAVIKSRDVIPLLLSNGADPSEVLKKEDGNEGEMLWGRIPLIEAAARGYLDTLQLLLRHGADINGADSAGMSAFEAAEQNDRREVVRFLQTQYLSFIIWLHRYAKRES